jgi:peptidoglycan/LPS O-acetylase OafA/YrhL
MGAVRLILALIVAADHFRAALLTPAGLPWSTSYTLGMSASFAVMFFFIISGFLISTALSRKYEATRQGMARFYKARLLRIFSLYWPLLVLTLLIPITRFWAEHASIWNVMTAVFLFGQDWNFAFGAYPIQSTMGASPTMSQSWTLGAECTFYVLAPFLLRSWKAAALVLIASAAIRVSVVYWTGGFHPIWSYAFFPSNIMFFLMGHFIRCAGDKFAGLSRGWVGLTLVLASVSIFLTRWVGLDSFDFWLAAALFTASLPGLFAATKDSKLLNALGDLSYPVYLTHVIVFHVASTATPLTAHSAPVAALLVIYLAAVLLVAGTSLKLIEKPFREVLDTALSQIGRRRTAVPALNAS